MDRMNLFKQNIKGKRAAVIGIGVSNTPLIRFLIENGAVVTAFDKKNESDLSELYDELKALGCNFSLGENYLSNVTKGFDYIFRTPGMRYDVPELVKAKNNGAEITSEMELFFELCPCEIFAITGSDGKTTTTTLTYLMLKEAGFKCWLGGNIGTPLLDKVEQMGTNDKVIVELSSFQLHTFKQSPHTAVITNLSPNHLDYHTSMDEYIEAKKNIFLYQNGNDRVILNYDNETTKDLANECKGKVTFFSRKSKVQNGITAIDGKVAKCVEGQETYIMDSSEILLPGVHNVENYLAAISTVYGYVSHENIRKVARTFTGVEHRNEPVREVNGVRFYNDSIGSSPARTCASIRAFEDKVILIAGGYDKKIPYDDLGPVIVEKAKKLVLLGKTADKIEASVRAVAPDFPIYRCESLEESVHKAYEISQKGDIVILSPASASFDMFKNFEERGNAFKEIVNNL